MLSKCVRQSLSPGWQALSLCLLTVAVTFARRPDQFLHPYFWMEEVQIIIPAYADRHIASMFEPIGGYLVLASRAILVTAFLLSNQWAPEIAVALVVAFSCAVIIAIALSPTLLKWRFPCALVVLFVPTGPDIFGVALMAFWWAGFLLILALVWDSRGAGFSPVRLGFIIAGGLSNPIIFPVAGLLAVRAVFDRRQSEYIAAGLALAVALVQYSYIAAAAASPMDLAAGLTRDVGTFVQITGAYVGSAFVGPRYIYYFSGPITIALLGACAWYVREKLSREFWLLLLMYLAVTALSISRANLDFHGPLQYGSRYFLYPFTILFWLVLWIAYVSPMPIRAMLVSACLTAPAWVYSRMSERSSAIVSWRAELAKCQAAETHQMPALVLGQHWIWYAVFTREQCRRLS